MGKGSMEKKTIYFVTSNEHKIAEAKAIAKKLAPFVEIRPYSLHLEEPRGTFEEISKAKARQAFKVLKAPLFVEDAGIIIDAFSKKHQCPGPYSRWVYETFGLEGVLGALEKKGAKTKEERGARFISVITYTEDGETFHQFKGTLEGYIADDIYTPPEGQWQGMFYDKIFIPEGYSKTISMLGEEIKNEISHRRKALESFLRWLAEREGK